MNRFWRVALQLGWSIACLALLGGVAQGQVQTTSIIDTVYRADGGPASGSLLISWPAFTTVSGASVPAGKVEETISADGTVDFGLAANSNSQPQGTYYTVVYHLGDGTVSTEYWTVPGVSPTTIAAVRSQVVPATVAVQSATVSYVNSTVSGYLPLSGGTLVGPLFMQEDPEQNQEAATKHYVDSNVGSLGGGLSTRLSLQPTATQTVVQPTGTTLTVNNLQNIQYAAANQSGSLNNGISNTMAQAGCASGGCLAVADPGYAITERPQGYPFPACFSGEPGTGDGDYCGFPWPLNSRLWDQRLGSDIWSYSNPISYWGGLGRTHALNYPGTPSSDGATVDWHIFDFDTDYGNGQLVPQEVLTHHFAGGHNENYGALGGWTKTNLIGSEFKTVNFSQGQHSIAEFSNYCLGVGDCMGAPVHIIYAGGMSAASDEGTHSGDQFIDEDTKVFLGPCQGAGCTAGSTAILVCAATANPTCSGETGGSGQGDQGEGRFAIDISQASGGNVGTVTGSGATAQGTGQITAVISASGQIPAQFIAPSGTFTPSTGLATLTNNLIAPAGSGTPGTQTIAITLTSGSFAAGSTICIADSGTQEQASVSAVGSGTITASFRRPHLAGALIAQGGTCGYLITLNADTANPSGTPYRMAIPMMGSLSSTNTYFYYSPGGYDGFITPGQGTAVPLSTAWNYYTHSVSAAYNSATNLVTVTGCCRFSTGQNGIQGSGGVGNINGESISISGATSATGANDGNYNGSYLATVTGENSFTYTPTAAPTSSSLASLTFTFCNCTFTMYPGAEVLSVYNSTTKTVDGSLTLGANAVAWNVGDLVEEPHWYMPYVNDTHNNIGMWTPQFAGPYGRGYYYSGMVSGQLRGFQVNNDGTPSQYFGHGGNHVPPQTVFYTSGLWSTWATMLSAPESTLISVGCKASSPAGNDGCTKWDAAYSILGLANSNAGSSYLNFDPAKINLTYIFDSVSTTTNMQVGENVSGTSSGLSLNGSGVSLFTPAFNLNGGTALTGQTGTGANIVTDTGATLVGPTLNGTTTVPSGQTLTVAGMLNVVNASLSGNLTQAISGTATSTVTHFNSSSEYLDGSVWTGSAACTPAVSQQWVMNSPTSWALTYGGVGHTSCAGLAPVITENLTTFADGVQLVHLLSANETGKTTTITAGTGAGTSPTVSLTNGTDLKGTINVTTGTSPSAASVVATISFGTAYQNGPVCQVTPASASAMGTIYSPPAGTGSFTLNTGAAALAASTSYTYSYSCLN